MEIVLDALKAMGKATYREVAARLKIEPVEALNMLREHRDRDECEFGDGGWWLTGSKPALKTESTEKPKSEKLTRPHGEEPAEVDPEVVRQLLAENGAMKTAEITVKVGRNARGMVSVMRSFARAGIVVMNGEGKGVTWSLPATVSGEAIQPKVSNRLTQRVLLAVTLTAAQRQCRKFSRIFHLSPALSRADCCPSCSARLRPLNAATVPKGSASRRLILRCAS